MRHGLRVGCGYAWWNLLVRGTVQSFREKNPDRSVLVDISNSLEGLRKVLSGDISMFLGTRVEKLKSELALDFTPLFKARLSYFDREGHPLAWHPCTLADVMQFSQVNVVPVESGHMAIVNPQRDNRLEEGNRVAKGAISTNSMTACIDLLTDSNAIL